MVSVLGTSNLTTVLVGAGTFVDALGSMLRAGNEATGLAISVLVDLSAAARG